MAEEKTYCTGCSSEMDTTNVDCDLYSQYWCEDCGGVSQCGQCGHMMASQDTNFDDGDPVCENYEDENNEN